MGRRTGSVLPRGSLLFPRYGEGNSTRCPAGVTSYISRLLIDVPFAYIVGSPTTSHLVCEKGTSIARFLSRATELQVSRKAASHKAACRHLGASRKGRSSSSLYVVTSVLPSVKTIAHLKTDVTLWPSILAAESSVLSPDCSTCVRILHAPVSVCRC